MIVDRYPIMSNNNTKRTELSDIPTVVKKISTNFSKRLFSKDLMEQIKKADENIFPNYPACHFHLYGAEESPRKFVSDDMLQEIKLIIQNSEIDPFEIPSFREHFHLNSHDLLGRKLEERQKARLSEVDNISVDFSHTISHISTTLKSEKNLESLSKNTISEKQILGLFWKIHDTNSLQKLSVEKEGRKTYSLIIHHGELINIEGPIYLKALTLLNKQNKGAWQAKKEHEAKTVLFNALKNQQINPYTLHQTLCCVRESVIDEFMCFSGLKFIHQTKEQIPHLRERLIQGSWIEIICKSAQKKIQDFQLFSWTNTKPTSLFKLTDKFYKRAIQANIKPEIICTIEHFSKRSLKELLSSVPKTVGMAGIMFMLSSSDAIYIDQE